MESGNILVHAIDMLQAVRHESSSNRSTRSLSHDFNAEFVSIQFGLLAFNHTES
jgi:hypothetical protein